MSPVASIGRQTRFAAPCKRQGNRVWEKPVRSVPVAILRDARLWRAPQDEVWICGMVVDPHGEERRLRCVSNHEAEYVRSRLVSSPRERSDMRD